MTQRMEHELLFIGVSTAASRGEVIVLYNSQGGGALLTGTATGATVAAASRRALSSSFSCAISFANFDSCAACVSSPDAGSATAGWSAGAALALLLTLAMVATISANSGLSEAPPTRKPSCRGMGPVCVSSGLAQ